jgi:protein gp37
MDRDWVISVRDQCRQYRVPFFFKQWGGVRKSKNGRLLDDRTYDEYPERIASVVPDRETCAVFARDILNSFA